MAAQSRLLMRRLLRATLACACIALLLLLSGCGYILVEDSSSATMITAPAILENTPPTTK